MNMISTDDHHKPVQVLCHTNIDFNNLCTIWKSLPRKQLYQNWVLYYIINAAFSNVIMHFDIMVCVYLATSLVIMTSYLDPLATQQVA